MDNLLHFDIQEVISAFVVLFAVIDITGLVPIIIDLKEKGNEINAGKAAFYSLFCSDNLSDGPIILQIVPSMY